ncbi:MAG TPA: VPDSG-CTERM sorting domain-containing protein [Verrucomicrobiae bacterium]|nr:VPDSG-CTERM sorting domain-containing protein [Verrucomicrobiae bacterium]
MKKKLLLIAAVAAMCGVGVAQAAPSDPINGQITFAGGVTLDNSSAGGATEVLSWTGPGGSGMPIVISSSGTFSGIAGGTAASFTAPWFFNSTSPVNSLWSVGGFTFDLTSSHIVFQGGNPAGVLVDGIGAVMGNGLAPEAMTWEFATGDPSADGVFSFQVADGTQGAATVPDGGTTAMLLGLGVLGLGLVKKQMFA